MMRFLLKAALALAPAALLPACSAFPERGPAPAPPPGYRAVCTTEALPLYLFTSTCTPVLTPPALERRAVVRAKG